MNKITLIKLGGSLITEKDKQYTARMDVIQNIASQLKKFTEDNPDTQLILGNGGGSFPHYPAVKYSMKEGIKTSQQVIGFAEVQDAAARLNRIVVREFLDKEIAAASVNPSSIITTKNGFTESIFLDSIKGFLSKGITPVVYGDIIFDSVKGSHIFSTEDIFSILIEQLSKEGYTFDKVVYLCTVDGVYDTDGKVFPVIDDQNWPEVKKHLYDPAGFDVTGGMGHKVESALALAKKGIKTYIYNPMNVTLNTFQKEENSRGTTIK